MGRGPAPASVPTSESHHWQVPARILCQGEITSSPPGNCPPHALEELGENPPTWLVWPGKGEQVATPSLKHTLQHLCVQQPLLLRTAWETAHLGRSFLRLRQRSIKNPGGFRDFFLLLPHLKGLLLSGFRCAQGQRWIAHFYFSLLEKGNGWHEMGLTLPAAVTTRGLRGQTSHPGRTRPGVRQRQTGLPQGSPAFSFPHRKKCNLQTPTPKSHKACCPAFLAKL